jgi:hypothetical protein
MTDKDDDRAALKAEIKAELKAEAKAEAEAKSTFVPMTDAEWIDQMHQMRERQANTWTPPSAIQEMASHPCNQVMAGVISDRHAPNTPTMIPRDREVSRGEPEKSSTPGYVDPIPLGPSIHQRYVDAQIDAQDAKDRAARELQARLLKEGK